MTDDANASAIFPTTILAAALFVFFVMAVAAAARLFTLRAGAETETDEDDDYWDFSPSDSEPDTDSDSGMSLLYSSSRCFLYVGLPPDLRARLLIDLIMNGDIGVAFDCYHCHDVRKTISIFFGFDYIEFISNGKSFVYFTPI